MKNKKIILVRHGESSANRERIIAGQSNSELTRLGIKQARRAAAYIKNRFSPVDVIYSSPLKRAHSTAEHIARRLKARIIEEPLLQEADFGSWEGLKKDELQSTPQWEEYAKNPFFFQIPGGESFQDVRRRVERFKKMLTANNDWTTVVVVTHYTPVVFFVLGALGNGDASRAPFKIDNASLSVIEQSEASEYIRILNALP
jgi:broad specificity phosphatase PhoE